MSDQLIVEREGLEKKDKNELQAIVSALGGSSTARTRKSELIDQILELSGATARVSDSGDDSGSDGDGGGSGAPVVQGPADGEPTESAGEANADRGEATSEAAPAPEADRSAGRDDHPLGPDGEPLADWEVKVLEEGGVQNKPANERGSRRNRKRGDNSSNDRNRGDRNGRGGGPDDKSDSNRPDNTRSDSNRSDNTKSDNKAGDGNNRADNKNRSDNNTKADTDKSDGGQSGDGNGDEDDPNNRRSRRRGRNRNRDRDDAGNDPVSNDPVEVEGHLDLRDEGYAFLRVNGALPSRDDAYVSVKQVRTHGLRKGDHVVGLSRPANRNEKNPALQQITTVNGSPPDEIRKRPRFDRLTPLFPDERLVMERPNEPLEMTSRIIDLVAPIGKGQRGLIVSPPKAGKTSIMKQIARSIEVNNPEVELIVLLIDERPEEVTDMKRHLERGEVVSSTFDRPPEEHTAVAELTLERAKRRVEEGADVCIIVDGITRLARAYNMSAPQSGRVLSGGVDAAALYPPKRFLGAARNIEEGGSLTMLATALVETGSRMDEVIFEEFKGTGNLELRLDRRLAERRIFPAIDIEGSSTRNEELLRDRKDVEAAWKLRKVIAGMNDDAGGSSGAGIEMLVDRLRSFKTNADFLAEIVKTVR